MFELPEMVTLARQINETLRGKTILRGALGNSPHKFVWYSQSPDHFAALCAGKTVGAAYARGKWLFTALEPGYTLVFGECGGKLLYHEAGAPLPLKYHLWITFEDGTSLTAMTAMWGAYELYEAGKELQRKYIQDMRPTPVDPQFDYTYLASLIDSQLIAKRTVKGLLTQEQLIPGVGNAIAQDIMFRAQLHPRRALADLTELQRRGLYDAIRATVGEAVAAGGRSDEVDLFGRPGGHVRIMDSKAAGRPCPVCGTPVEKIQYLGGACCFCSRCQE